MLTVIGECGLNNLFKINSANQPEGWNINTLPKTCTENEKLSNLELEKGW
jgi:hypothetical protein